MSVCLCMFILWPYVCMCVYVHNMTRCLYVYVCSYYDQMSVCVCMFILWPDVCMFVYVHTMTICKYACSRLAHIYNGPVPTLLCSDKCKYHWHKTMVIRYTYSVHETHVVLHRLSPRVVTVHTCKTKIYSRFSLQISDVVFDGLYEYSVTLAD